MKRCSKGRNVACGPRTNSSINNKVISFLLYSHRSQLKLPLHSIIRGPYTNPTKRSTMAQWMIKYLLWLCSWRCLTNTIMVRRLRMTTVRYSVLNTANNRIHCDGESGFLYFWIASLQALFLRLEAIEFQSTQPPPTE